MRVAVFVLMAWMSVIPVAHAYLAPGLGAGVIGTVLGVIGAVFLAIFGIVYYPIKRLLKRLKAAKPDRPASSGESGGRKS